VLAIAKPDLPSPNPVFGQLNDGVFHSFVFHDMRPPVSERDIRQNDEPVCPLVNLMIPQALELCFQMAATTISLSWQSAQ
jgi:hypothetical protein